MRRRRRRRRRWGGRSWRGNTEKELEGRGERRQGQLPLCPTSHSSSRIIPMDRHNPILTTSWCQVTLPMYSCARTSYPPPVPTRPSQLSLPRVSAPPLHMASSFIPIAKPSSVKTAPCLFFLLIFSLAFITYST